MLGRLFRSIMTSETVKKVPIPPRGVDYRGKIVLAPMVRSGELPSRLLALHYGADLVWGPETVDRAMIGTTRRVNPLTQCIEWTRPATPNPAPDAKENVIYRMDPRREAGRLIFQLGTSDPERAVAAARIVAADVAGIDVNAGCPKPFSTHAGMGAALLREPDRLVSILDALVAERFDVGVSVKIRLLETAAETEALVRRLVATGIAGLTVHCRTTPMRPRQRAIRGQLRMVAGVCREAGVACLMNGDVEDRDQALRLVDEYGVDGAMIATAAETNSSCFRPRELGGLAPWAEVVEHYLRFAMEVGNRFGNTKYLLAQMVPGKAPEYRLVNKSRSFTRMCDIFGLEGAIREQAIEADLRQGIEPGQVTKDTTPVSKKRSAKDAALNAEEPSQKQKVSSVAAAVEKAAAQAQSQSVPEVALSM
ncbi:uncharacterized protein E0L32_000567 [Thyridium curvatum]|uniref:DUS-like FMN-binding domain-containing protein n=1 Tax=Thyridium curvatum TaxID=1093900 RepID=A0A507B2T8_9PEZI|nr:uncharacterized protein E0L32_000567 [Thyridium curvatum]TPX14173.1 hypothetical protein E0L32_000567 [Thyridium curvatum]